MKEMFSPDNLFNEILTKIFDIVLLNILWLICCIPVVTIGASTTALYTVTLKMVKNHEGAIIKSFFAAFKENLKKTVPVTLLMVMAIAILVFDFHVLGKMTDSMSSIAYGGCVALAIILAAVFSYTYPLMAKFENTIKNTLINAGKIAITHLGRTVIMVVLNILPLAWLLISPETLAYVFLIWLLAGGGIIAFVNSYMLNGIFDKLIENSERYL